MRSSSIFTLSAICIFLTACSTTVVTDEDRKLPDEQPPVQQQDFDSMEDSNEMEHDDSVSDSKSDDNSEFENPEYKELSASELETIEQEESGEGSMPNIWTADSSQSFIAFTGAKGNIVSHEGKFTDFTVEMSVPDPENFSKASLEVIVQIASLETDSDGLTKHLLSEDFFDAAQYPVAKFESSKIREEGAGGYIITGTLTMHGVSQLVEFEGKITDSYLVMSRTLDRTKYGIGSIESGPKSINKTVPVEVKIVFAK